MFTQANSVHSFDSPTFALSSQKASKENHRFFVGTCSLHDSNKIHLIEYQEDINSIQEVAVYDHKNQVFSIESSSHDECLLLTSWLSKTNKRGVTLYRTLDRDSLTDEMQRDNYNNDIKSLDTIADLDVSSDDIINVKWHNTKDRLLTGTSDQLSAWSIVESDVKVMSF